MKRKDELEDDLLEAYERGELVSERASAAEKEKFLSAARATSPIAEQSSFSRGPSCIRRS